VKDLAEFSLRVRRDALVCIPRGAARPHAILSRLTASSHSRASGSKQPPAEERIQNPAEPARRPRPVAVPPVIWRDAISSCAEHRCPRAANARRGSPRPSSGTPPVLRQVLEPERSSAFLTVGGMQA
jgi:hypothetical protein